MFEVADETADFLIKLVSESYSPVEDSLHHLCQEDVEHYDYCHGKEKRDGERRESEQNSERSEWEDECGTDDHQGGHQQILPGSALEEGSSCPNDQHDQGC